MSGLERRRLASNPVEIRAEGKDAYIDGIIFYNTLSEDLGGYREKIAPCAFTRCLNSKTDIKAFWAHDEREILGSTTAGTMTLENRAEGLHFSIKAPASAAHRVESIGRGDASGVSFGFIVDPKGDEWSNTGPEHIRTLKSVRLLEISPGVAFAAYPDAHAATALRSMNDANESARLKLELALYGSM